MSTPKEPAKPLPPYVPYRTFLNFVASLRQGMPGRIDRTLMGNLSGAMQSQLFGALRYLKLINEQDIPEDVFERLAKTEGAEQQKALREILETSYPFLFNANGFSLTNATLGQFEEQFKKQGANGDTVRKCGAFFLSAAKDADIPISPRIAKAPRPRPASAKPRERSEQSPSGKRSGQNGATSKSEQQPQTAILGTSAVQSGHTTRTLILRSGERLTLAITGNVLTLDREDRQFVFGLIDAIEEYEQTAHGNGQPSEKQYADADDIPF